MSTLATETVTHPEQSTEETARWLRFLARWALVMVLLGLGLVIVDLGGIGFAASDNALGAEYAELLQAVRAPGLYRLAMTFDTSGWLMMGGGLVILAGIVWQRSPIRALLIAACGVGALTGILGGAMRLVGISDLATHYASATTTQQAGLLQAMLALHETIGAFFVAGNFLVGAGYLLVASVAFELAAFPRWLASWFVLAGVLSLVQGTTSALGAFSFLILLPTVIIGVLGLHAALAVTFWHPSLARIAAGRRK